MISMMPFRFDAGLAFGATFAVLMVIAAGSDLRRRRIPNALSLTIALAGVGFTLLSAGPSAASSRVPAGVAVGLAIWIPFWLLRMLGAGDVKFFAAASAWLGPRLALDASMVTAVMGGVLALCWLAWSIGMRRSAIPIGDQGDLTASAAVEVTGGGAREWASRRPTLPYGVAMASGLMLTAWASHVFH